MYARLTTIVFAAGEENPAQAIHEGTLPVIEQLDGFKGMVVLTGMDETSLGVLTLWETAEALANAQPVLEGLKQAETSHRRVESKTTVRYYVAGSSLNSA